MAEEQIQIDSGILQLTPKGAHYGGSDKQFRAVYLMKKKIYYGCSWSFGNYANIGYYFGR